MEPRPSDNVMKKVISIVVSWCFGFFLFFFFFKVLLNNPLAGIAIIMFAALATPMLSMLLVDIF